MRGWADLAFVAYCGGALTLELEAHTLGQTTSYIFVDLARIDRKEIPQSKKMAAVLEELCHCYYMIVDEWDVKVVVMQILHLQFPELRLHSFYSHMFDEDERPIRP